ncbi:hypothetical protein [Longirhabdus pacifica]|uniref:hypothetical protein n=1 Tax=Longirhabdus pacifica TaxID=2305227 RepID=UPI001008CB34|nr:hypothetical protein [Longirhabdus pacifica]
MHKRHRRKKYKKKYVDYRGRTINKECEAEIEGKRNLLVNVCNSENVIVIIGKRKRRYKIKKKWAMTS